MIARRDSERFTVGEIDPGSHEFVHAVELATRVSDQARYLTCDVPKASESHILGAFVDATCVGFLRYLVQQIGADVGRPPLHRNGRPLTEGYVEAFGVAPAHRRHGIGRALQQTVINRCREDGCHQVRSRSPATSTENYALKIEMGFVASPSEANDSYYFILRL